MVGAYFTEITVQCTCNGLNPLIIVMSQIPGSTRSKTEIVAGVVCSKNIQHKKMRHAIQNPRILLLRAPIEYQRVENKFSSLEPQILQVKKFQDQNSETLFKCYQLRPKEEEKNIFKNFKNILLYIKVWIQLQIIALKLSL